MNKLKKIVATYELEAGSDEMILHFRLEILSYQNYYQGRVYRKDLYRLQPFAQNQAIIADESFWVLDPYFSLNLDFISQEAVVDAFINSIQNIFPQIEFEP